MNADRRQRVEDLCHAALERDLPYRAAFVATACGSDEALRREVEALLAHAQTAEGFLAAPLEAVAARVLTDDGGASLLGRSLGPYQISARLGSGGMGEVYRAHDTKLGRDVAIKILPAAFTHDAERLARFRREARVLATLNHPNIGAIYGLEAANGLRGIVLELVEGESFADRLRRGPMPIKEVVGIARQIADALEAAHEKAIVHRDLKPANVKITLDGVVKVLDFGLAKASGAGGTGGPGWARLADASAVVTIGGTKEGAILGTAAYMSPEQARGQAVDKRTDIWAFGCVLYEMLTGRVAFAGDTITDTLAAVIDRDPDWSALPPATPPSVHRLLRRCLAKEPKERLRDIGDAAIELSATTTESPDPTRSEGKGTVAHIARGPARKHLLLGAALGALVAAALATSVVIVARRSSAPPSRTMRFALMLGEGQQFVASLCGERPAVPPITGRPRGSSDSRHRWRRHHSRVFPRWALYCV
ncbi:MAG: hypothetical protein DMF90_22300 [Acidobacteria bacterium]|nr:MAG: hypothetical protein DMF90_22300 [Acidobacteriota bacterium]